MSRRKVPLPYRLRDLRVENVGELAHRIKPPASGPVVEYTLPGYFHQEHSRRNLPAGEVIRRNKSGTVRVRLDVEAYEFLLESAVSCYRSPAVTIDLRTSARRTIKALLNPDRPVPPA